MTVGLDIGASAVKAAGLDGDEILFTYAENGRPRDLRQWLSERLKENDLSLPEAETVALTGVGAEGRAADFEGLNTVLIPEIEATGRGGTWLSGRDRAVVVSLGTGTSLVLAVDGKYTHIGGSGVGSGTVRGLGERLFGIDDLYALFELAEKGDAGKVDLRISDLFSGTDTLLPELTASNLAKPRGGGSDADWAAGIINLALEVAGSHGALACAGFGLDTVIITGGLSTTAIAERVYAGFDRLYPQTYIIPPHSGCATAIGAAGRAELGYSGK